MEQVDRQRGRHRLHGLSRRDRGGQYGRACGDLVHGRHSGAVHDLQVHRRCLRRERQPFRAIGSGVGEDACSDRDQGRAERRSLDGDTGTGTTITLSGPVHAGDLLVGWFGQFDSTGPVQVSDNVNGSWTRSASTTFSSGNGDIALNVWTEQNGDIVLLIAKADAWSENGQMVKLVKANTELAVEFTANNPGATLLLCHQQDHMDRGLMMLLRYT